MWSKRMVQVAWSRLSFSQLMANPSSASSFTCSGRERVRVPAGCDGYENEGVFVLRHDAYGRVDVVLPRLLDDLCSHDG